MSVNPEQSLLTTARNCNEEREHMKCSILAGAASAACLYLGLAAPILAAETPVTGREPTVARSSPSAKRVATVKPAEKCLNDLRAFEHQLDGGGYWLGGSGYGYGYPLSGYGFIYPMGGYLAAGAYQTARPSHEV